MANINLLWWHVSQLPVWELLVNPVSVSDTWSRSSQATVSWIMSSSSQSCTKVAHWCCLSDDWVKSALRRIETGCRKHQGALLLQRKRGTIKTTGQACSQISLCQSPLLGDQCLLLARLPVPGLCLLGLSFTCGAISKASKHPQSLLF